MHDVECVSVELAVSTIPCMKWNVYLLTWLCFNNPMHKLECVSVDMAMLQQ